MGVLVAVVVATLPVPYLRTQRVVQEEVAIPGGPATAAPGSGGQTATPGAIGPGGYDPATVAGPGGSGGGSIAAGGASAGPTGNDVGVSAAQVTVGISILDAGGAAALGASFDTGRQEDRWKALIADANAKGGVNGRKIVPRFRKADLVNDPIASTRAACIGWTKDDKVFTVLYTAQLRTDTAVCVTGEGGTPLVTSQGLDEAYYASRLLYSTGANNQRLLIDHARYLARTGVLAGHTVGVLSGDGADLVSVNQTLLPELARLGTSVKRVEVVPGDISATQRMPVAVSNFKAAGVDLVIMAASSVLVGPFATAASRSNYAPLFAVSDFNYQVNDALSDQFPDAFDGTVALSIQQFPTYNAGGAAPAPDAACIGRVRGVEPAMANNRSLAFGLALIECGVFDTWLSMARKAGPALSRASLAAAAEQTGPFPISGSLDGSFGPGKFDAVDQVREVVWKKDCHCWKPVPGSAPRRIQ
jgi:ABC-type branched-subunit amino acid transport system substrate-binding protein